MSDKWQLIGRAYGRNYNKSMEIMGRKMRSATFITEDGHTVKVITRYVGSVLGDDDDTKGNTICGFVLNGKYLALAYFNDQNKTVKVHEY